MNMVYMPTVALFIFQVEVSLTRFGTPHLGWRFSLMSSILFGLAFMEHGLHNWLNTRPGGRDDIAAMSASLKTPPGTNFTIDNSVRELHNA